VPFILKSWDAVTGEMMSMGESMKDPASQESVRRMVAFMQHNAVLSAICIWLIFAFSFMGFATIGGIIGVSIFEKRRGQPDPPQWPPSPEGYPPSFTPTSPPPGGPIPPPGQAPYGGGEPPPY
jgi:hypothetical protein